PSRLRPTLSPPRPLAAAAAALLRLRLARFLQWPDGFAISQVQTLTLSWLISDRAGVTGTLLDLIVSWARRSVDRAMEGFAQTILFYISKSRNKDWGRRAGCIGFQMQSRFFLRTVILVINGHACSFCIRWSR
ncbi:unnamed protein product, partial [Musa banksii]